MAEELQSDEIGKNSRSEIKKSIRNLKEKILPGVTYSLVVAAIFNFSMLVIGCLNVHRCPVSRHIPLFLIATGAIGLMSKFTSYVRRKLSRHPKIVYFESSLYAVESIFFFLGSYWVYKEYKPSYDPADENKYCDKTAYLFAFIYLTIFYSILVLFLLIACCGVCGAVCFAICTSSTDETNKKTSEGTPLNDEAKETLKIEKEVKEEAQP